MHICVDNLGHHWFRYWLVACSAPSHYLNQYWNIVSCTLGNGLHWNFNWNLDILIQINAKSRPFCLGLNVLRVQAGWCYLSNFDVEKYWRWDTVDLFKSSVSCQPCQDQCVVLPNYSFCLRIGNFPQKKNLKNIGNYFILFKALISTHLQGLTLSIWFTCPSGTWF